IDPPKIKCPNVRDKTAEPGKLTVRVTWDTPEGKDTADGILTESVSSRAFAAAAAQAVPRAPVRPIAAAGPCDPFLSPSCSVILKGKPPGSHFPEGDHKISYTVYDRAGNKGSCRFSIRVRVRRCTPLTPPDNGYMKCDSDGDNYGATCEFFCLGGFELQGSKARVCQSSMTWAGAETTCIPMNINVGVRTAAALLDQFYEKRRVLIVSAPTAANHYYRFQMDNLQHAQCGLDLRHVTVIELVGIYPAQIGRIRHRLIPPGLALQLRLLLQISHNSYNMVLIDKQGIDKMRYTFPITAAELFATIDTFPLRKEEMLLQQEAGQTCQS
ncbi:sushi repeat-containing protein SRPX-like, partial [Scleropages formosus]